VGDVAAGFLPGHGRHGVAECDALFEGGQDGEFHGAAQGGLADEQAGQGGSRRRGHPPREPPGSPGALLHRGLLRTAHARSRARGPSKPLGRFRSSAATRCLPPAGADACSGGRWRVQGASGCCVRCRAGRRWVMSPVRQPSPVFQVVSQLRADLGRRAALVRACRSPSSPSRGVPLGLVHKSVHKTGL
jgi:hypothetical protein